MSFSQGKVDGFFKAKGHTDFVLGSGVQLENKFFAGDQKIGLSRNIINGSSFIAAGITDKLNLNMALPYIMVNKVQNFQDLNLQLKYRLFEYLFTNLPLKLNGGLSAGYSFPTNSYETEGLNAIGQQAKVLDARAFFHFTIHNAYFITIQSAQNFKSNPTPNAFNTALKFGHYSSNLYWDVWYDFQQSNGGLNYRGVPTPVTFKELGVDYHKIGGTMYKPLSEKTGIFTGLAYALTGRNIGQGIGVNIGFVFKYNFMQNDSQ